jgi:predicted amidohydrolase
MNLRVALVVPDLHVENYANPRHAQLPALAAACNAGEVDLVVLPEAYYQPENEETRCFAEGDVEYFGVPVLVGVLTATGFNVAQYLNPKPAAGETKSQIYVKHSTSGKLAFDWPGYRHIRSAMFQPIILKGRKIGVQICHDMFFGLLGQRWRSSKANVFINLTGGGVNARKWTNMIRGRSLDLAAPYLCAMSIQETGVSTAISYRDGRVLPSIKERWNKSGSGWALIDVDARTCPADGCEQDYTDKVYKDITVSIGSDEKADVNVRYASGHLAIKGATRRTDGWFEFKNRAGHTGVLPLPAAALADGLAIHRADAPRGTFDHHIVLFHTAEEMPDHQRVLDLMKARAIEHRIGVLLLAGRHREAVKTNRYKNIQRFRAVGSVFGFDANFLGGTWSTSCTPGGLGITEEAFPQYLARRK